jgi:primosomal replication protein N
MSAADVILTSGRLPTSEVRVDWKWALGEGVRMEVGGYLAAKERRRAIARLRFSLLEQ